MLKDRVKVSTNTSGTGVLTLGSADPGFQDFSKLENQHTYYAITNRNQWEVGIGLYSSGNLYRNSILDSSSDGNRIDLLGKSSVFVTYPSDKSVYLSPSSTASSGDLLFKNYDGWNSRPLSSGDVVFALGYTPPSSLINYTANGGIVLSNNNFSMGGTGNLDELKFSSDINIGSGNFSSPSKIAYNSDNIIIGFNSGASGISPVTYNYSNIIALGFSAVTADLSDVNNFIYGCIGIGTEALKNIRLCDGVTAIGNDAGFRSTNTVNALILGRNAGSNISGCSTVSFIGRDAGSYSLKCSDTNGLGDGVWLSSSGIVNSIGLGGYAGSYSVDVQNSVFIGSLAGRFASGNNNVYLGYSAGFYIYGSNNIEIISNGTTQLSSSSNNKIHIQNVLIGDSFNKKLALGNVSNSNINPNATLEILPKTSTDKGFIVRSAASQVANLVEVQNSSSSPLFSVSSNGSISGVNQVLSSGVVLNSGIPSTTTSTLYSSGNDLRWQNKNVFNNRIVEVSGAYSMNGTEDILIIQSGYVNLFISKNFQEYRGTKYHFKSLADDTMVRCMIIVGGGNNYSDTIDGVTMDYKMKKNDCVTMVPVATGWYILSKYSEIVDGNL